MKSALARGVNSSICLAAAVAAASSVKQARAATLYLAGESTGVIYQFPNAGYTGTTISPGAGNTLAAFTDVSGLTVDSTGNVVATSFNGASSSAAAFSTSGAAIATSPAAYGDGDFTSVVYNNTLYSTVYTQPSTNDVLVQASYSSSNGSASIGSASYVGGLTVPGGHGLALAVLPAGVDGSASNYLVYATGSSGNSGYINALNLSNGNSPAFVGDGQAIGTSVQVYSLVLDSHNGDFYALYGGDPGAIYQYAPTITDGSLTGFTSTQITLAGGGTTASGLDQPISGAFGPDGNLYIDEQLGKEIDEINVDGNGTTGLDQLNEYIALPSTENWGLAFTPEPASAGLLAVGGGGMLLRRRRRQSRPTA